MSPLGLDCRSALLPLRREAAFVDCCFITTGLLLLECRADLWAVALDPVANSGRLMAEHHARRVVTLPAQGQGVSPYMGPPSRTKWTPGCCMASGGSSAWPTAGKTPMAGGQWHPGVCTHAGQSPVGCRWLTLPEPGRSCYSEREYVLLFAWVSVCGAALHSSCCQGASCTVLAWTTSAILPSAFSRAPCKLAVQSFACACPVM